MNFVEHEQNGLGGYLVPASMTPENKKKKKDLQHRIHVSRHNFCFQTPVEDSPVNVTHDETLQVLCF